VTWRRLAAGAFVAATLAAGAFVAATLAAGANDRSANASDDPPDVPGKTIPTLPPSTSTVQGGVLSTGIGLRAAASLPEFLPVVKGMIGATSDVAGELGAIADVPNGILSPDGSTISQFSVAYDALAERFVATATFRSDASAEDAVVFYQATLTAAGFTPMADSGAPDDPGTARRIRFDNPNSTLGDAGVEVTVTEGAAGADTEIELTIIDFTDAEVLNAFSGWAAGLPTLSEGSPIAAEIHATAGPNADELTMTLTTVFGYVDYTPEQLGEAVRAALPDGGFSVDPENDAAGGTAIALHHIALAEPTIEIGSTDQYPATLLISGTVTM
jgi:hypothetical protein